MHQNTEQVVQRNLDSYNQRDIDGFMSSLASTIEVFGFAQSEATMIGADQVRAFYTSLFEQSPKLCSTILKRIVIGNKVIDHEHITGRNGLAEVVELVLVYEVNEDKISKITVIRG